MTVYRIKNWAELFETSESRKRVSLPWVAIPTKHDGKGYRRLMREFGPAVYGAWILICAVAAKCPMRGVLADADGPLSALDIADKTDCPVAVIEQALSALTNERIGWLELANLPELRQIVSESAGVPADGAGTPVLPDRTGQDRTKQLPVPVSGDSMNPFPGKAEDKSIFRKITAEDLRDDAAMLSWFKAASQRDKPVIKESESDLLNVFAAAEHALGRGKKPPALFAVIVGKRKYGLISQDEEDRARKRLLKLRRAES